MNNLRVQWAVLCGVLILVLGYVNYNAWLNERVISDGRPMLLDLEPVDPRSLMQGDYMVLRYELTSLLHEDNDIDEQSRKGRSRTIIVTLDDNDVATFSREDNGSPLAPNEQRLQLFGRPYGDVSVGTESYFFEEGTGELYQEAAYGAFRVSADGSPILVGLVDASFEPLGDLSP